MFRIFKKNKNKKEEIYNSDFRENVLRLSYVKCIKSVDDNFIVGKYYPVVDYNNGWTIMGEKIKNRDSYFKTTPFHCYGEHHDPELYECGKEEKYIFI